VNVVSAVPGNGDAAPLHRVLVLAMAAPRLHMTPPVGFHMPDEVSNLHEKTWFIVRSITNSPNPQILQFSLGEVFANSVFFVSSCLGGEPY
jgi:hypothetical protein